MGVEKWELKGELQESLGTAAGEGSMVSGQRMVDLQWELGVGRWELNAAGSRSPRQLRVYDGD